MRRKTKMQFEAVLPIKVGATAIDRVGIEGGTGEVGICLPALPALREKLVENTID